MTDVVLIKLSLRVYKIYIVVILVLVIPRQAERSLKLTNVQLIFIIFAFKTEL